MTGRARARDLGVPSSGTPGLHNAITDVPGVEVGHVTLVAGDPERPQAGPVIRTGVTAIHPLGRAATTDPGPEGDGVIGGWFALNGHGEMTGTTFLDEIGAIFGPLALTNTLSVGTVRDALVAWSRDRLADPRVLRGRTKPVVAETWDGELNDVYGMHIRPEHVYAALDGARGGPVAEGAVGGGTGMTAYGFKAGSGTSSRRVRSDAGEHVVGVLVQANYGRRRQLRIGGVPVGAALGAPPPRRPREPAGDGSIIVVIATDAPLLPLQTRALARRASLALGRLGSIAATTSGDLFLALSTGNRLRYGDTALRSFASVPTEALDPFFAAVVDGTEEAIVNTLVAAAPMSGVGGSHYPALPHDALRDVLARHGRLVDRDAGRS